MARTADPHVDSFLAFECWTLERFQLLRHELPWCVPPDALPDIEDPVAVTLRRNHARRHDVITRAIVAGERDRMIAAGFDPSRLKASPARVYLVENANRVIANHVLGRSSEPPKFKFAKNENGLLD